MSVEGDFESTALSLTSTITPFKLRMLSRITSSLKTHSEPSFTVDFDQTSVRSAGSRVEGTVKLTVDTDGEAGGTGRKRFSELSIRFGAIQVSLTVLLVAQVLTVQKDKE